MPPALQNLRSWLSGIDPYLGMLWLGLMIFSIALIILMYTRWGQTKAMHKCMGLSLLAHFLFLGYAATIEISRPAVPLYNPVFQVSVLDEEGAGGKSDRENGMGVSIPEEGKTGPAWEELKTETLTEPEVAPAPKLEAPPLQPLREERAGKEVIPDLPSENAIRGSIKRIEPSREVIETTEKETPVSPALPSAEIKAVIPQSRTENRESLPAPTAPRPASELPLTKEFLGPSSSEREDDRSISPSSIPSITTNPLQVQPEPSKNALAGLDGIYAREGGTNSSSGGSDSGRKLSPVPPSLVADGLPHGGAPAPAYKERLERENRGSAARRGANPQTERAVSDALKWLSSTQEKDGHWKPTLHGAGKEEKVLGRDRNNAGSRADTGITGLALLSLLAAGNTHQEGPYKEQVRLGLEYLMRQQGADGQLGGEAAMFERMYCHAMAGCALSEAYGMTRDERLGKAVEAALQYSLRAQDPRGGGWRYNPGDAGDVSQLGWQLLFLKSAELGGRPIPQATRQGAARFLNSVAQGKHGGLASYRPGEQVTRTMTAEALVCWLILGLDRNHPAVGEATQWILQELPGQSQVANDYYWYYGTLGFYHLQGEPWEKWNAALQKTLLDRQVKEGPFKGSWNTDTLWGGYGGRVYTTAMAALCLEVYYRFLPLFDQAPQGIPSER